MNWTTITEAAVKTAKTSLVLAKVRSMAAQAGDADPLPEMIADVVATLRAACSTGNQLDVDTTKIPNSLKGLALRMIVRSLKDYLQMPLTQDERDKAAEDLSYRNRISDQKMRFETPDNAAATGEMQSAGSIEISTVNKPFAGRQNMNGLL